MKVENAKDSLYLVTTYMPTDNRDDETLLRQQYVLGELQCLLDKLNNSKILIIGT